MEELAVYHMFVSDDHTNDEHNGFSYGKDFFSGCFSFSNEKCHLERSDQLSLLLDRL